MGFRVLGFGIYGLGFGIWGPVVWDEGLGFGVWTSPRAAGSNFYVGWCDGVAKPRLGCWVVASPQTRWCLLLLPAC